MQYRLIDPYRFAFINPGGLPQPLPVVITTGPDAARPTGPAAALLELAEISAIELLVSDATLHELQEVLNRPSLQRKFPSLTTALVTAFIERIK